MRPEEPLPEIRYVALERLRVPSPVDRLDFIAALARGKRVFDLGALDETAVGAKKEDDWLHARLACGATWVVGIDNSEKLDAAGMATGPTSQIIRADILDLDPVIERHGRPDLIVAGELIEHLSDTSALLRSLGRIPSLRGAQFVFSTPNACCWHNAIVGLAGCESMHPDHLQIYSYKTLRTLFARSGMELCSLVPYHARFTEMIEASAGLKRAAVRGVQTVVNILERAVPVLSGGWIGIARL